MGDTAKMQIGRTNENKSEHTVDSVPKMFGSGNITSETEHKTTPSITHSADSKVQLERRMGLTSGVAMIVGTMIGSGIFISPRGVLLRSGSVATCLLVWLVCGLISIAGASCYIELGCVVPKSGGDYAYLLESYGPLHNFFGPIPAFLYSYSRFIATGPAASAVLALSFGVYAVEPFYTSNRDMDADRNGNLTCQHGMSCTTNLPYGDPASFGPPAWLPKLVAAGCIVLITAINCFSVLLATRTQNLFTAIKVTALAIIVVTGMVQLGQGNTQELATGFTPFGESVTAAGIVTAFYSGFWAYGGWSQLNLSVEELMDPHRNLPRAMWIALPLVIILYILTNVAYLSVMTVQEVLVVQAVAVTFGNRVLGVMAWIIPFSVACSTFGAANGSSFGDARVAHVAAREGHLMFFLSFVSVKWLTPLPAVLSQGFIALLMVSAGSITSLIDFISFTAWIFYALVFAGVLILRHTRKKVIRSYTVPLIFPLFMLAIAVGLVVIPIALDPRWEYLYASLFILTGLVFYVPLVFYQKTPNCMGKFTEVIQYALGIAPPKINLNGDVSSDGNWTFTNNL